MGHYMSFAEALDFTPASLEVVDKYIDQQKWTFEELEGIETGYHPLFDDIVAYVGVVIHRNLDGAWIRDKDGFSHFRLKGIKARNVVHEDGRHVFQLGAVEMDPTVWVARRVTYKQSLTKAFAEAKSQN